MKINKIFSLILIAILAISSLAISNVSSVNATITPEQGLQIANDYAKDKETAWDTMYKRNETVQYNFTDYVGYNRLPYSGLPAGQWYIIRYDYCMLVTMYQVPLWTYETKDYEFFNQPFLVLDNGSYIEHPMASCVSLMDWGMSGLPEEVVNSPLNTRNWTV
jgi:hypothetical protein